MTVNRYFQKGVPESYSANQKLVESMIVESIQISGTETYYIPRTLIKIDTVLSEATVSEFADAFNIEMYLENVQGFEGDGGFLSKFGITVSDSCTFVVARKRWAEETSRRELTLERPCEGDIVFFPLTKSFFEIKKVNGNDPFYQLGKLFIYKLECEMFRYGSEEFNTGNVQIDDLINGKSLVENRFAIMDEDGTNLMDELGMPVGEDESIDEITPGAQNAVFDNEGDTVLNFSESNPFGDVK